MRPSLEATLALSWPKMSGLHGGFLGVETQFSSLSVSQASTCREVLSEV